MHLQATPFNIDTRVSYVDITVVNIFDELKRGKITAKRNYTSGIIVLFPHFIDEMGGTATHYTPGAKR